MVRPKTVEFATGKRRGKRCGNAIGRLRRNAPTAATPFALSPDCREELADRCTSRRTTGRHARRRSRRSADGGARRRSRRPATPPAVGPEVLAAALAASADGLALLDEQGRYVYVNPAGLRAPRRAADDLLGSRAVRGTPTVAAGADPRTAMAPVAAAGIAARARARVPERAVVRTADGRPLTVVTFRDVTDVRLQRRRFTAFATAAANVAYAGSLRGTLDAICAELVRDHRPGRRADLPDRRLGHPDAGARRRAGRTGGRRTSPLRLEEARQRGARAQLVRGAADRAAGGRPRRGRRRCSPTPRGRRCTTSSTASTGTTSSPCPWWSATARSARSTPTAGPGHDPDDDEIAFLDRRWPTTPRSPWRTPGCSPRSAARRRSTSGTGWPASCTTRPASSCSR